MSKKVHRFDEKLEEGLQHEEIIRQAFEERGYSTIRAGWVGQKLGVDFHVFLGPTCTSLEVKADTRAAKTGNFWCETKSSVDASGTKHGWVHTSQAQLLAYYIPPQAKCYLVNMNDLKTRVKHWRDTYPTKRVQNHTYYGEGIAVPLAELEEIAVDIWEEVR